MKNFQADGIVEKSSSSLLIPFVKDLSITSPTEIRKAMFRMSPQNLLSSKGRIFKV